MSLTTASFDGNRALQLDRMAHLASLHAASARSSRSSSRPSVGGGPDCATSLRGSLLDHPFPSLMHRLHDTRATGTLLLASGKKRKAVQLRDGRPVAVKSNLIGECLGNYLVRRGQLARDDFEESLTRVKRGDGKHGEILVMMDLLSEETVSRALYEQAEEKLFEIFEWRGGGFKFKLGARISRGHALALTRSPADLIVEGARHRISLDEIDAFIHRHPASYVVHSENSVDRLQDIELDEKETELLQAVDGHRQLADFRTAEQSLRRLLYGLIATQIFELRSASEVSERHRLSPPDGSSREVGQAGLRVPKTSTAYRFKSRKGEPMAIERRGKKGAEAARLEFFQGEARLRRRDYQRALVHFAKALEWDAEAGEYHAHYGWCLFLCHPKNEMMLEEAIEHVRRGAKLARDLEKPYLFLGRLYKVLGKMRPAERMFTRAVEIQPGCVDAMRELRLIEMRRGKEQGLLGRFFPVRGKAKV